MQLSPVQVAYVKPGTSGRLSATERATEREQPPDVESQFMTSQSSAASDGMTLGSDAGAAGNGNVNGSGRPALHTQLSTSALISELCAEQTGLSDDLLDSAGSLADALEQVCVCVCGMCTRICVCVLLQSLLPPFDESELSALSNHLSLFISSQ